MKNPPRTEFSTHFAQINGIEPEFSGWHFLEGMGFQEARQWWGVGGLRKTPHEGIDLFYFRDHLNTIKTMSSQSLVPPLMAGEVVAVFPDFIGQSILFRHFIRQGRYELLTLFGHLLPGQGIVPGKRVHCLDCSVGMFAPAKKDQKVPGHLHISIFWCAVDCHLSQIDWSMIRNSSQITLVDPLQII